MRSRLSFILALLRERLWLKPLLYALLAVGLVLAARLVDHTSLGELVPQIDTSTIYALVTVISASMLGVATFAVASMVSAYSSASSTTTPRAFSLLVQDRASQNALSSFVGSFIFSVVAIVAIRTGYYGQAGRFALFLQSLGVMTWVIVTFVRWVDHIARLGRLGNIIDRVEDATARALAAWGSQRTLCASPAPDGGIPDGVPVTASDVGYVQHVDVQALQAVAEEHRARIRVTTRTGTLASPARPLAVVQFEARPPEALDPEPIQDAFVIGDARNFVQDPRFGLIAMSETASRALSPAVNDPGTGIQCLGRLVKIFCRWKEDTLDESDERRFDRVEICPLDVEALLEDGFGAIARDGRHLVEVGVQLQKALAVLAALGHPGLARAARAQARMALERSRDALDFEHDRKRVEAAAAWIEAPAG